MAVSPLWPHGARAHHARVPFAALLGAALCVAPGAAAQEFFPGRHWPANFATDYVVNPVAIAVADMYEDGVPDLLTANEQGASVAIVIADGVGGYGGAEQVNIGNQPVWLATGDVNGDGHLDVVTASAGSDNVTVLLGNGMGGLSVFGSHPVNGDPRFVLLADLNEDGALDIVTANTAADTVAVLAGNGAGGFGAPQSFATGDQPWGVAAGDLNEDGHLDLVAANFGYPGTLSLLLGNGAGGFLPTTNIQADDQPHFGPKHVVIADWNGDGHQDLINASNTTASPLSFHLGNGLGSFAAPVTVSGGDFRFAVADVDLDGALDVVAPNGSAEETGAWVYRGDGAGGVLPVVKVPGGSPALAVAIADLDGDGLPDAALADGEADEITVLRGDGTPQFTPIPGWTVDGRAQSSATADMNLDGRLDVVILYVQAPLNTAGRIAVMLGDGTGSLLPATIQPAGQSPLYFAIGDLDEDGAPDVVVANPLGSSGGTSTVSVLRNNGAGVLLPQVEYATGAYSLTVGVGDVNADGHLDVIVGDDTPGAPALKILRGNGTGQLGPPASFGNSSVKPVPLLVADVNGDGFADALVNQYLRLNNGAGGLLPPTLLPMPLEPDGLALGDVDEDGLDDLVAGSNIWFAVLHGDGAGHFAQTFFDTALKLGGQMAIADLDGDGHADLAGLYDPNFTGGSLRVAHGDGKGAFGNVTRYTAGYRPTNPVVIDLDRDGRLDLVIAGNYFDGTVTPLHNLPIGTWIDVGSPLAGSNGTPKLVGISSLQPKAPITLRVIDGPSFGSAALVIGSSPLNAFFKGGILVPLPSLILFGLPLDAAGDFSGSGTWYGGLPPGTSAFFQAWMMDAGGPCGYSATNALEAVTPAD